MKVVEIIQGYSHGDGINKAAVSIATALSHIKGVEVTLIHERGVPPMRTAVRETFVGSIRRAAKEADIVHSHIGTGVFKASAAKLVNPRIKHVTTYSVIAPKEIYAKYHFTLLFHKLVYAHGIDAVVGISKYACDDFHKRFGGHAQLIYDGVDLKEFKPDAKAGAAFRRVHGIGAEKTVIGFVSRFDAHKNHAAIIRALPKLPKDTVALLGGVGGGKFDTMAECKQLAHSLGVSDRVVFAGFIQEKDMNALYNSMDIHAFPSLWEGFGLSVLEASAVGKPTVGFPVYSIKELVGRVPNNGILAKDQHAFTSALSRLSSDSKLRRKFGAGAKEFAKDFAWEKVAIRYKHLFDGLMEERGR
jgi:glycosyltransferase involved in cell wall biosynthesis